MQHVCVCACVCVYVHQRMCVWRPMSSLAHLPGRRPLSRLPFLSLDSCELDSGTRGEGRKEGGRGRGDAGLEFEKGGEKRERGGKEVDIQREWLSLDQPLPPSLPPPCLGTRCSPSEGARLERKEACPRVSFGISAPAPAGLGGGEGAETRRQIRLVSRGY